MTRSIQILLVCLIYPISLFSQQITGINKGKEDAVSPEKLKAGKNKNIPINLDLTLKTSGGEMINYQSYQMTSPFVSASLKADLDFNLTKNVFLDIAYKIDGEKLFQPVPGTPYTLDRLRQNGNLSFGFDNDILEISANMDYNWMLKPNWPDLYQPNPLLAADTADPAFGAYFPTDRNSYHKLEPGLDIKYGGIKKLDIFLNLAYTRNLEYTDPMFDPNTPTHLPPSTYTGYSGEIGAELKLSRIFGVELKNTSEYRSYDIELARDALTGKTHYSTTPNPLYTEFSNETTLTLPFKFSAAGIRIKPFFSLKVNTDLYQGYYSFTGLKPGIQFEHEIGNFKYELKFSEDMELYGPFSFDPAKTTDGKSLYKYSTNAELNLNYRFNKHFDAFIEGSWTLKQTNYPAYVPGVNPGKKNYNIDFNYENYVFQGGVSYKL